jgi:hypothetical protein
VGSYFQAIRGCLSNVALLTPHPLVGVYRKVIITIEPQCIEQPTNTWCLAIVDALQHHGGRRREPNIETYLGEAWLAGGTAVDPYPLWGISQDCFKRSTTMHQIETSQVCDRSPPSSYGISNLAGVIIALPLRPQPPECHPLSPISLSRHASCGRGSETNAAFHMPAHVKTWSQISNPMKPQRIRPKRVPRRTFLFEQVDESLALARMRSQIHGGSQISERRCEKFRNRFGRCRLINKEPVTVLFLSIIPESPGHSFLVVHILS